MAQSNGIGSFEAKTRLAELLREIEAGAAFVITRRGRPVARLIPFEMDTPPSEDWREGFLRLRRNIGRGSTAAELRSWLEEGRK